MLRNGYVAEQGTHSELMEIDSGVYADLWNAQLHDTVPTKSVPEEEPIIQAKA